jgi:hypothetical protein
MWQKPGKGSVIVITNSEEIKSIKGVNGENGFQVSEA